MSFTAAAGTAARSAVNGTVNAGARVLRGANLSQLGRTVGVMVSAVTLAAVYQSVLDESRGWLRATSTGRQRRHARHEAVLVTALGRGLTPETERRLLKCRDAFDEAIKMLADPKLAEGDRTLLRSILAEVSGNPNNGQAQS